MKCESENYIVAHNFMAAIKPDIKRQPAVNVRTMEAVQNGMRSHKLHVILSLFNCGE